jgi:hypothetical protein
MKSLLFALIISVLSLNSFGQDRVNATVVNFVKSSHKLTKAVVWAYDETFGVWIEHSNKISTYKVNTDKDFISIQFKTWSWTDDYILLIEEDNKVEAYVISNNEYWTIMDLLNDSITDYARDTNVYNVAIGETIEIKTTLPFIHTPTSYHLNHKPRLSDSEFCKLIQSRHSDALKEHSEGNPFFENSSFFIKRTTSKGEFVIRFTLPVYNKSKEDFEKEYFEITLQDLKLLLIN